MTVERTLTRLRRLENDVTALLKFVIPRVLSIFIQCTSLTFLHSLVHLSLFNNLYFIYINFTLFQPRSWTQPWGQGMYFVLVCISELRQLDGRGKTKANLICVTSMTIILFEMASTNFTFPLNISFCRREKNVNAK